MENMERLMTGNLDFYKGKKVLVTGHTGFKGAWMSKILIDAGAELTGYSRGSKKELSLFKMAELEDKMNHIVGDVRDRAHLADVFEKVQPEIVLHLAAQPIVRDSYIDPLYTYETNVMGTLNVLECVRNTDSVKSVVNVTTDKVYLNREWCWGYREDEMLDGFDPYSNSKSCSELVTHSYVNSFFNKEDSPAVSTVRAGNVIGGGDFAKDRIIPDCIRAINKGETIKIRNPYATRPYQHVLEPVVAYLMIAEKQYSNKNVSGSYNIGPDEKDCVSNAELVSLFCRVWGNGAQWEAEKEINAPHEANYLKLDCSKIKNILGWEPRWSISKCMEMICTFNKALLNGENISSEMQKEIEEYFKE